MFLKITHHLSLSLFIQGNYRGAAALYEQMVQNNPDGLANHEVHTYVYRLCYLYVVTFITLGPPTMLDETRQIHFCCDAC